MGRLLDHAISPGDAVSRLAKRGIHISERALRKRARELGACRVFGKAMLLLPEHLHLIFQPDITPEDVAAWHAQGNAELEEELAAQGGEAPTGVVYFAASDDRVKIGYTTNLPDRLRAFRTASADDFDLLLTVKGTAALERFYHRKFEADHLVREWFSLSPAIRDFALRRSSHG